MKVNNAISTPWGIKFNFDSRSLMIHNDGSHEWSNIGVVNRYFFYLMVIAFDMFKLLTSIFPVDPVPGTSYLNILSYLLMGLFLLKSRENHAIEHILITAHDEDKSPDVADRIHDRCGARFLVYILILSLIQILCVNFISMTLTFLLAVLIDRKLPWIRSLSVKVSRKIQLLTTVCPSDEKLELYHRVFTGALYDGE